MLSAEERERGRRLGAALRSARGTRSMVEVAAAAGVPTETLRKIETGRVPTPAFFTVVSIAAALEIRLTDLVGSVDRAEPEASLTDLVGSVDPAQAKPRRARTTVATAPARASA